MKKLITLLAVLALAFGLTACDEPPAPPSSARDFSGYCIRFTCPSDWKLSSVEEEAALVGVAVIAANADETAALKLFCTPSGVQAYVLASSGADATQTIGGIRASLEATVNPETTYNNIKNGVITVEKLIDDGEKLPAYSGGLPTDTARTVDSLPRVDLTDDGSLAAVLDSATGRWGYIDRSGRYAVAPQYINAGSFSEGKAAVAVGSAEQPTWGYIDTTGAYIKGLEPRFQSAGRFGNGLAPVHDEANGSYYVNADGTIGISAFGLQLSSSINFEADGFGNMSEFRNGVALVSVSDFAGSEIAYLIRYDGKVCCQVGADLMKESFDSKQSLARQGYIIYRAASGYYGVKDDLGYTIIGEKYDLLAAGSEGPLLAQLGSRYGYIGLSENVIVPFRYQGALLMSAHGSFVETAGGWQPISTEGALTQSVKYEQVTAYINDYACFCENGLWGVLDGTGSALLPPMFSEPLVFSENGLAAFRSGELTGFLTGDGEVAIEPKYAAALPFTAASALQQQPQGEDNGQD